MLPYNGVNMHARRRQRHVVCKQVTTFVINMQYIRLVIRLSYINRGTYKKLRTRYTNPEIGGVM